jgi:histidinol-phosphate/aromatic aminotransferase/cobyric acid decarboxylase-like protein
MSIKVTVQKNLIAVQDLLIGFGTVTQRRGKTDVIVDKINAGNLPFSDTKTLQEAYDEAAEQLAFLQANQELLTNAVSVITLLQNLSVSIDELALWLTNGSNTLSAFHAYAQRVNQDEVLASNLNYTMLEDTIIEEDVTITLGENTKLYILKGEEVIP